MSFQIEDVEIDLPLFVEGSPEVELLGQPAEPWEIEIFPSGAGYEEYVKYLQNPELLTLDVKLEETTEAKEDEDDTALDAKYAATKKKSIKDLLEEDYYELLGLGDKKYLATQDDIKKAYRKAVLRHHPDKQAQAADGEEGAIDDELFKRVQKAYEVLTNPQKKKRYDSREPFDDTIPSADDVKSDADFYKVFGPVFERNAKWSTIVPVPKLGDENTHIKEVEKFYNFWFNFKTWRDFSYLDEYDVNEANSREERRWMERKNAKEKAKRDAAEAARIFNLAELANRLDPRMKAQREKERLRREEEKRKRLEELERRKKEEEARRREIQEREEAERLKKQQAEEAEKAERARITNAKKKRRQRMRQALKEHDLPEDYVEFICARIDLEEMDAFVNQLNALPNEKAAIEKHFQDKIAELKKRANNAQREKEQEAAEAPVHWTAEEVAALTRAVIKFPGGTRDRWEKIQKFLGTDKTIKQIIARVKNASAVTAGDKVPGIVEVVDAPETFQTSKKDTTFMKHDPKIAEASVNWEKVLASEEKVRKEPAKGPMASAASASAGSTAPSTAPSTAQKPVAVKKDASDAAANWTQEEQRALELAMKKYPSTVEDRWGKIAAEVPGRTKKECIERFKYLAAIIKQNKK